MARKVSETRTEAVVARVLADPYTQQQNLDGGAAAAEFIREAGAGLHNPPIGSPAWQVKEAARQARIRAILAQMGR
jgi:hypothetical protein